MVKFSNIFGGQNNSKEIIQNFDIVKYLTSEGDFELNSFLRLINNENTKFNPRHTNLRIKKVFDTSKPAQEKLTETSPIFDKVKKEFDELLNLLKDLNFIEEIKTVRLKDDARVFQKLLDKEEKQKGKDIYNHTKDIVRGAVVIKDLKRLKDILKELAKSCEKKKYEIVGIKDRITIPHGECLETGYKDMNISVLIDGVVCEIQIHLPETWTAKEIGQVLYTEKRVNIIDQDSIKKLTKDIDLINKLSLEGSKKKKKQDLVSEKIDEKEGIKKKLINKYYKNAFTKFYYAYTWRLYEERQESKSDFNKDEIKKELESLINILTNEGLGAEVFKQVENKTPQYLDLGVEEKDDLVKIIKEQNQKFEKEVELAYLAELEKYVEDNEKLKSFFEEYFDKLS